MFWTYQNGLCMLVPLGPFQPDGSFDRGVYLYTGPSESHTEPKWTKETGFVKVPDDNGDSWGAGNFLHGALWYIEAPAGTNLYDVLTRFHAVINNQKRAATETSEKAEFQDTAPQEAADSNTPPEGLSDKKRKQWDRDHGNG